MSISFFLAGEGWQTEFESIDQSGQSSEVERNPKMSISFFDELGVLFCILVNFCCWDHLVDHQKLNVIYKNEYFIFDDLGGLLLHFSWLLLLGLLGRSPEVEHNLKMSISFFWLERGSGWGLSPLTSPAHHQKLNVIPKWAFHFIGWRGMVDGVWVHQPAWPIIRSWT